MSLVYFARHGVQNKYVDLAMESIRILTKGLSGAEGVLAMNQNKEQIILDFELGDYLERRGATTDNEAIKAIDDEVWNKYGEYWSVMYTDLSGFSRHVYKNGLMYTLGVIHTFRGIALPIIEANHGILVKTEGDSLMILFKEVREAYQAAIEMTDALQQYNAAHEDPQIFNACGIGYGQILKLGDYDIYGLEVNLASKLGEDIGKGSELLLTESAKMELDKSLHVSCESFIMDADLGLIAYRVSD